ncbi:MAG: hypothetical protein SPJ70_06210, partial [Candidatus Borkfalkiaceae bacterium]|nr:hypothetical protein [Christensenellaceae bacterium]
ESKMTWYEKLDLKLSHYSLPIVPILSFLLAVCTICLGVLGYPVIRYSLIVYAVMILFLCSPMIPDFFVYNKSRNAFLLLPYFIINVATYASLAPMMLKTVLLGVFGKKATFIVTPKESENFSVFETIKYTFDSLVFAVVLGALSLIACGSLLPVIFVVAGCFASPFIVALSNISLPTKKDGCQTATVRKRKFEV